jgi:hypothetical protein
MRPYSAGAPSGCRPASRTSSQTAIAISAADGMSVPVTLATAIPPGHSAHSTPATTAAGPSNSRRPMPYTAPAVRPPATTPIILMASSPPPSAWTTATTPT